MSAESLVSRLLRLRTEAACPLTEDRLGRPIVGPCWLAWSTSRNGYGRIKVAETRRYRLIHRASYEIFVGPIENHVDHLCRIRACYNPSHLEDVTRQTNVDRGNGVRGSIRKTRCKRGHPFDAANTYVSPAGGRFCRACVRMHQAAYYRRKAQISSSPQFIGSGNAHCGTCAEPPTVTVVLSANASSDSHNASASAASWVASVRSPE